MKPNRLKKSAQFLKHIGDTPRLKSRYVSSVSPQSKQEAKTHLKQIAINNKELKKRVPKIKNKKLFILDTNVLMDDPDCIFNFRSNNDIIIPITVVRELDKNKNRLQEARLALKNLDTIGADNTFKSIKNGGTNSRIKIHLVEENTNQLNDDVIIRTVDEYNKANNLESAKKYTQVIFVTNDRAAAIKARALGVTVENYKTNEVDIDSLYTELSIKNKAIGFDKKTVFENGYVKPFVPLYWRNKGVKDNHMQSIAIDYMFNKNITLLNLIGQAGVGKTWLAILAALKQVDNGLYEKVIITKPTVPVGGADIGFLPGTKEDKMLPWVMPIKEALDRFLKEKRNTNHQDALKKKHSKNTLDSVPVENFDSLVLTGKIELESEAFLRGRSIENAIFILDEGQNLSTLSMKTLLTRMGENAKLVITGDYTQIDAPYLSKNNNGLAYAAVKTNGQAWSRTVFLDLGVRSVMSDWVANNM